MADTRRTTGQQWRMTPRMDDLFILALAFIALPLTLLWIQHATPPAAPASLYPTLAPDNLAARRANVDRLMATYTRQPWYPHVTRYAFTGNDLVVETDYLPVAASTEFAVQQEMLLIGRRIIVDMATYGDPVAAVVVRDATGATLATAKRCQVQSSVPTNC